MKIIYKILVLNFMIINVAYSATWVDADLIDLRAFTDQVDHYIGVKNFSNPNNCSISDDIILQRNDSSNWKMVHTTLLSGFMSGIATQVRTSTCSGGGTSGYPVIDGAKLLK